VRPTLQVMLSIVLATATSVCTLLATVQSLDGKLRNIEELSRGNAEVLYDRREFIITSTQKAYALSARVDSIQEQLDRQRVALGRIVSHYTEREVKTKCTPPP
jgi:hypothetical protein